MELPLHKATSEVVIAARESYLGGLIGWESTAAVAVGNRQTKSVTRIDCGRAGGCDKYGSIADHMVVMVVSSGYLG